MERKIGETFEFKDKTLQVKESASSGCDGCFFDEQHIPCSKNALGYCGSEFRTDKKKVIFVDEQPQELNLCEILKYCPQGEIFWSPMLGNVKFDSIDHEWQIVYVISETSSTWHFNSDATITLDYVTSAEIMLYPSKEQRDWNKFTAPWYKKEIFDPKTLKPFDRVLIRNDKDCTWRINIYSHKNNNDKSYHDKRYPYVCINGEYSFCIPYNDDTKHLAGTTEEAPDYYRYWEKQL